MRFFIFTCGLFILSTPVSRSISAVSLEEFQRRPKLFLVIVIDQFRADYLTRFEKKFLPSTKRGFQFLMSQGAYYPFAEYGVLQAMTGPGHSIIMTGSYPYLSGISTNEWYANGKRIYCVEDERFQTLGGNEESHLGTSPKLLNGTTVGDEIKNASLESKSVSIAPKDRASILLGGHRADLALWFDKKSGWTTSTYYLPSGEIPAWVQEINRARDPKCALEEVCGAETTIKLAIKALSEMRLGRSAHTDILTVSLSGHDYAGHRYGPNHPKMEELTLAEDRLVSQLVAEAEGQMANGLRDVVVVLTADHGVAPSPEFLDKTGIETGRVDSKALVKELEVKLQKELGGSGKKKWIAHDYDFNFYFDQNTLATQKISSARAEQALKKALLSRSEFAFVVTKSEVAEGRLPPRMIGQEILSTYSQGRSGDVIAIPKPYFISGDATANHMTGYSYDSTVPLILYGKGIESGVFLNSAHIVDIAPTLAALAGVIKPSLAEGRVLSEALTH